MKISLIAKEIVDKNKSLIGYHLPGSGNEEDPLPQRKPEQLVYNLEIFGKGGDGSLSIEPEFIDFDIVKVNFNKKVYATLYNKSDVTFYVEVQIKSNAKDQDTKLDT